MKNQNTTNNAAQGRVDQLQQQQGTRLIRYRGVKAQAQINQPHEKATKKVFYRGAKADLEV